MNARNVLAMVAGLVGSVAVTVAGEGSSSRASAAETSIRGATNIVFRQWKVDSRSTKSQQFTVAEPGQVRRLTGSVLLGAETGNQCEFLQQAEFQGPSGRVLVQFNEHYFVVVDPPSTNGYSDHTYQMPKDFYVQFQKLAKEQPRHAQKP